MKYILCLFSCLSFLNASAQYTEASLRSNVPVPRGEMRAAWISSVSNLDWPRSTDRGNPTAQKASLIAYLDTLEALNMNAAFLQVRSEGDAFYDSPYEPWSRYLGGAQGTDPGYDPLQFAIEEAHKRGIELHAWLNPYRLNASKSAGDSYYHENHIYKEHPEWAIEYDDGGKILNPGLPEVQEYLKIIVGDLINKYDLDGIHFDDYFYAYGGTRLELDADAYAQYGEEYETVGDFRRASINKMIANVWDTIQSVRPFIRFGVSPFGIYGNNMNPPGIVGLDAYNTIYCDPLAWLEEGTVDYITPQLYWPTGGSQDYATLLPWWADWVDTYDRHLYPGHGIYRLSNEPATVRTDAEQKDNELHEYKDYFNINNTSARTQADPWTLDQIVTQVEINRQSADKGALGSVYFRMYDFYRVKGLFDYLKTEVYFNKPLFPEMTWKSSETPESPANLRLDQAAGDSFFSLLWDHPKDSIRYAIYTFNPDTPADEHLSSENRLAITYNKSLNLSRYEIPVGNRMVVTALNRYGVEGAPSAVFEADTPDKVVLISPEDNAVNVRSDAELSWHSARFASNYILEVSFDESFTSVQSFILDDTTVFIENLQLQGESTYFWRVAGENIGGTGSYSDVASFSTGFPSDVQILKPENGETGVALQPEITWEASEGSNLIHIQISEGGSAFNTGNLVIDEVVENTGSYTPSEPLRKLYTHYMRIRGSNDFGATLWTPVVQFKTLMPTPEAPVITLPENNATDVEIPVTFVWEPSEGATSYVFQLSDDQGFDHLLIDEPVYGSTEYNINSLELGTKYWGRVAARNAGGLGDWSEASMFTTLVITGIDNIEDGAIIAYPNPGYGKFYLSGMDEYSEVKIAVTDMLGKEILRMKYGNTKDLILLDLQGEKCHPCLIKMDFKDGGLKTLKVFSK